MLPPHPLNAPYLKFCFTPPAAQPTGDLLFKVCAHVWRKKSGSIDTTVVEASYSVPTGGPV